MEDVDRIFLEDFSVRPFDEAELPWFMVGNALSTLELVLQVVFSDVLKGIFGDMIFKINGANSDLPVLYLVFKIEESLRALASVL